MDDGSHLAFFEAPDQKFNLSNNMILIYILLWRLKNFLVEMFEEGKRKNVETRGISDHGFISSIYFRDPNGCR